VVRKRAHSLPFKRKIFAKVWREFEHIGDPKIIDASYANFRAETPPNAEIDRAGAENILTTVTPPGDSRNLDDYIDMSLIDGLRAEGFIAAMEKKYASR
jgi:hypothetical protein